MKYIRTKDGRILKEADCADFSPEDYSDYMQCKLKEADTIEELCDWAIEVDGVKIIGGFRVSEQATAPAFDIDENWRLAVETEKGLIYVAKMNENGEWELL